MVMSSPCCRRLQKKSYELLAQVQKVISEYDFPLTLRQIYYQLVARQVIPNQQKYYVKLSRLCVIGRDEGLLDEDAFADRLRQIDKPSTWTDISDFMNTVKEAYRKDKWQDQKDYLEVWTEKDALRAVLAEITYQYDVSLMVVRGQVSRTAIYEAARRYTEKLNEGKNCYLVNWQKRGGCVAKKGNTHLPPGGKRKPTPKTNPTV